ncbi:unnamed protein product [Cuscuta campestris]|uniref:cytokinin riboside 5'-monophosphate phosphoribohydrolase n=1 Tax=Cuscuta campestris TaxID=132261 RepID=A0A484MYU0_9ASTE|nr:unnamed protein product [Cuscuta campestris]
MDVIKAFASATKNLAEAISTFDEKLRAAIQVLPDDEAMKMLVERVYNLLDGYSKENVQEEEKESTREGEKEWTFSQDDEYWKSEEVMKAIDAIEKAQKRRQERAQYDGPTFRLLSQESQERRDNEMVHDWGVAAVDVGENGELQTDVKGGGDVADVANVKKVPSEDRILDMAVEKNNREVEQNKKGNQDECPERIAERQKGRKRDVSLSAALSNVLYKEGDRSIKKGHFQSLKLNSAVSFEIIDLWTDILNHKEKFKSNDSSARVFFPTKICDVLDYNVGSSATTRNKNFVESDNVRVGFIYVLSYSTFFIEFGIYPDTFLIMTGSRHYIYHDYGKSISHSHIMEGTSRTLPYTIRFVGLLGRNPKFMATAVDLGRELIRRRISLAYGGGNVGLQGVVASTVFTNGGLVRGFIPGYIATRRVYGPTYGVEHTVSSNYYKYFEMNHAVEAFIVLPRGVDTMGGLFTLISWASEGLHNRPIGLLNIDGYFNNLIKFLYDAVRQNFMSLSQRKLFISSFFVGELLDKLEFAKAFPGPGVSYDEFVNPGRLDLELHPNCNTLICPGLQPLSD